LNLRLLPSEGIVRGVATVKQHMSKAQYISIYKKDGPLLEIAK